MKRNQPFLLKAYTQVEAAHRWCDSVQGLRPLFVCAMGFTETALIPGISAAGETPDSRRWTAIADAEVLLQGYSPRLPTAPEGYPSPVVISQAICQALDIPVIVFDCGLPEPIPQAIPVQSTLPAHTASCLSSGQAMPQAIVQELFQRGIEFGRTLSQDHAYLAIGECVAGGTSTALAVLMGLGINADGRVNSSHPVCNHRQKLELVRQGLKSIDRTQPKGIEILAAVGDPMQPFVAGMALSASQACPIMLAGGTQMLAIYAVMRQLSIEQGINWAPDNIAIGTTRWVAEDTSSDSVLLAESLAPAIFMASQLSFINSQWPQLQAYERGYVKEGVGAGGLAIIASLYANWSQDQLLDQIESTYASILQRAQKNSA